MRVVAIVVPSANFMPSSCQSTRTPAKKSDIMPTLCRWSVKVSMSVGRVEAGYGADFRIAQRSSHLAKIIGAHAHVAIADDNYFVRGIVHQARQFGDFVIGGDTSRTVQDAHAALGEIRRSVSR